MTAATAALVETQRRLDEARAAIPADDAVRAAAATLASMLSAPGLLPDQLAAPGREFIARAEQGLESLEALLREWDAFETCLATLRADEAKLPDLRAAIVDGLTLRAGLTLPVTGGDAHSSLVKDLHDLIRIGHHVGLLDGACPLCATAQDEGTFEAGTQRVRALMQRLNAEAAEIARINDEIGKAEAEAVRRRADLVACEQEIERLQEMLARRTQLLAAAQLPADAVRGTIGARHDEVSGRLERARQALRVLAGLSQNEQVERAARALEEANKRLARAQERAGRTRQIETTTVALQHAAQRAAGERRSCRPAKPSTASRSTPCR